MARVVNGDKVNPSTPGPEGQGLLIGLRSGRSLKVDPERGSPTPPSKAALGPAEWVKEGFKPGQNIAASVKEKILDEEISRELSDYENAAESPLVQTA